MSYRDVREWMQKVDEMGELKIVENADWNAARSNHSKRQEGVQLAHNH